MTTSKKKIEEPRAEAPDAQPTREDLIEAMKKIKEAIEGDPAEVWLPDECRAEQAVFFRLGRVSAIIESVLGSA